MFARLGTEFSDRARRGNCADFGEDEFINLKGVYKALKDGQAKAEDYFPVEEEVPNPMGGTADVTNK